MRFRIDFAAAYVTVFSLRDLEIPVSAVRKDIIPLENCDVGLGSKREYSRTVQKLSIVI